MREPLACLLLLLAAVPGHAACNMDTTDNTFRAGLDFNDVSDATQRGIRTVVTNHFTPEVEALRAGKSGSVVDDLEYTLRYVPNHYRALAAYAKWELQNPRLAGSRPRTADCYFRRAMGFRPNDPQLHALFGTYLHWAKRLQEARAEYETAESMGLTSAELYYNRGLLELDIGNVDAARDFASRAYAHGYPLPGLRNRLDRLKEN